MKNIYNKKNIETNSEIYMGRKKYQCDYCVNAISLSAGLKKYKKFLNYDKLAMYLICNTKCLKFSEATV